MKPVALLAHVACLASLVAAVDARMAKQHKRIVKRQSASVGTVPLVTVGTTKAAADASTLPADTTDPTAAPVTVGTTSTPAASAADRATSPDPLIPPVSSSTTKTTSTTSTLAAATVQSTDALASNQVATTVITSTASDQSASSASAAAASESTKKDDDSSSGVGKKTLIIVISVASAVGLVAAIWTCVPVFLLWVHVRTLGSILRKWKFSPSRKFEERLNPIDWNTNASTEKLTRADSTGSGSDSGLHRQNSWGSARNAAMSEVSGYNRPTGGSALGTGYAHSGVAPNYAPGYSVAPPPPPVANYGYGMPVPPYQQSVVGAHEYSSVTRQATQVHGGRYGEGLR